MKSKLNRFILISLFIHLLLLFLFSFQKVKTIELKPITVDLGDGTSRSLNKSDLNRAKSVNTQNHNKNRIRSIRSTSSTQKISSQKEKSLSLIRNNPPLIPRRSKLFSDDQSKNDSINQQIILDKSKVSTPNSRKLSPSSTKEKLRSGSEVSSFEETSVFNKSSFNSGKKNQVSGSIGNVNLNDSSSSGVSDRGKAQSTGTMTDAGNSGFKWKNIGQRTLISKDNLVFPNSLIGKGIDDEVVVAFKVAPDGKVYNIDLVKSSGYPELDSAVKNQVRSFLFNSIPSKKISEVEYSYLFKLEEK